MGRITIFIQILNFIKSNIFSILIPFNLVHFHVKQISFMKVINIDICTYKGIKGNKFNNINIQEKKKTFHRTTSLVMSICFLN